MSGRHLNLRKEGEVLFEEITPGECCDPSLAIVGNSAVCTAKNVVHARKGLTMRRKNSAIGRSS